MNALKWKRVTSNTACVYYMDRSGKWIKVNDEAPLAAVKEYIRQNQEQIYPYIVAQIGTRTNAKRHVLRKIMASDINDARNFFNLWIEEQEEPLTGTIQLLTGNWKLVLELDTETGTQTNFN